MSEIFKRHDTELLEPRRSRTEGAPDFVKRHLAIVSKSVPILLNNFGDLPVYAIVIIISVNCECRNVIISSCGLEKLNSCSLSVECVCGATEIAGVDNVARRSKGGQRGSGQGGTKKQGWTTQE